MHAFTCASAIGNLWRICSDANILIPLPVLVGVNIGPSKLHKMLFNGALFDSGEIRWW